MLWVGRKSFEYFGAEAKCPSFRCALNGLLGRPRSTRVVISIRLLKPGLEKFREKKLSGDRVSDKLKRTGRHATHRRKQFFRFERLVEKFVSADGKTCIAGFDAAGRTHNQDFGVGKV